MKLTATEKMRRATADAYRAAEQAHTAVWRAKRKIEAMTEATDEMERQASLTPPLRAFISAEATRQLEQARSKENTYYDVLRDVGGMAEMLGARSKP